MQVFWWRRNLQCWYRLAVLPVGSLYHTVCLDNLTNAIQEMTYNMASLLVVCLHSVGFEMPSVLHVVPIRNAFASMLK